MLLLEKEEEEEEDEDATHGNDSTPAQSLGS
jgi:hypothetical protein